MPGQSVDDIYVEIRLEAERLKSDLRRIPPDAERIAKSVETSFKSLKIDISNRLLKMKFSEIQQLHRALTQQLDRKIKLNANLASIEKTRTALRQVESALGGVQNKSEAVGKSSQFSFRNLIIGATIAYFAVTRLFRAVGNLIEASIKQAKSEIAVETSVRTTGYAAGFTATQLKKVASQLQEITGIGDEEILSGVTNQLLTFTQITGTSFDRATKAVLDLNAVINKGEITSLKTQAIQLGKALENPIQGIGALSRSGITFTEVQKKQIRNMIDQNDLLGAQNIILTEVENKYGGQAKALNEATKGTQNLEASWGDLKEALGDLFGPLLESWIPGLTKAIKGWIVLLQGTRKSTAEFKDEMKQLEVETKDITLDQLKKSTAESRAEMKAFNEEQINLNKILWETLKNQKDALIKQGEIRGGILLRAEIESIKRMEREQSIISRSNAILRGQNSAIDEIDGNIKKLNQNWSSQGKTIGEIQDRIEELNKQLENLSPDLDAGRIGAIQKEIDQLTKKIQTQSSAESSLVDLTIKKIETELELTTLLNKTKLETLQTSKATLEALLKTTSNDEERLKLLKQINSVSGEIKNIQDKINAGLFNPLAGKTGDQLFAELTSGDQKKNRNEILKEREDNIQRMIDAEDELQALRLSNIKNEFDQRFAVINAEYDFLLEKYSKLNEDKLIDDEKYSEAIQQIETARETELAKLQADRYSQALGAVRQIAGALGQALGDTRFVQNMQRALEIAEAIAAVIQGIQILGSIFSGGGAAVAALQSGGSFYRGNVTPYNRIPKFQTGTDFKVPGKYRNDSYLMRVGANERVQVTPAGKIGDTDRLLGVIANRIGVLNRNVSALDLSVDVTNNAPDIQTSVRNNKRTEQVLARNGINFSEQ